MEPFSRQSGAWTITHAPAGHSAYDRVLGRLSAWSIEIVHTSGWRIIEHEGEATAGVYSPGGLLLAEIRPEDLTPTPTPSLTAGRSQLLIVALTSWVNANAQRFDEPEIQT